MILNWWANTLTESIYTIDQFVDDDIFVGLVDNTLTDLLPNVWYLEQLLNFTQLARLVVMIAACVESTEQAFVALVETYKYLEDLSPPICNMAAPWDIVRRARGAAVHLRATPARMPTPIRRPSAKPPLAENLPYIRPRVLARPAAREALPPETLLELSKSAAKGFRIFEGVVGTSLTAFGTGCAYYFYKQNSDGTQINHKEVLEAAERHDEHLRIVVQEMREHTAIQLENSKYLKQIAESGRALPAEVQQNLSKDFDAAGVVAPVHKPAPISSVTGNFNPKPGEIMPSTIESFDVEVESLTGVFLIVCYVIIILRFLDYLRLLWRVKKNPAASADDIAYSVQGFEAVLRTIVVGAPFTVTFVVIMNSIMNGGLPTIMGAGLVLWTIFLLIAAIYWFTKRLKTHSRDGS